MLFKVIMKLNHFIALHTTGHDCIKERVKTVVKEFKTGKVVPNFMDDDGGQTSQPPYTACPRRETVLAVLLFIYCSAVLSAYSIIWKIYFN